MVLDEGEREGLFAFDPNPEKGPPGDGRNPHNKLVLGPAASGRMPRTPTPKALPRAATRPGRASKATTPWPTATRVAPPFQLLRERVLSCTPEWAAAITGIRVQRIRLLAQELGDTA